MIEVLTSILKEAKTESDIRHIDFRLLFVNKKCTVDMLSNSLIFPTSLKFRR